MLSSTLSIAVKDIFGAIRCSPLIFMLGWQDIRRRYRRSPLGPFWLTISTGVMISTIAVVFGQIFNSPMREYLPFLATGIILWNFISVVVTEGCMGFISAEGVIKQLPMPLFVHILRLIWRNVLILCHNIVILPIVFLTVGKPLNFFILLTVPGFFVALVNLGWVALLLGILCARYRDLPQMISSVLQIVFYLTPIMWMPRLLPERIGLDVLTFNPVFHVIEVIRAPLLGEMPSLLSWQTSILVSVIGWIVTLAIYGRYKRRIAYWL